MDNFQKLRLRYHKKVNNETKPSQNGNQSLSVLHKMKQQDDGEYALFFHDNAALVLKEEKLGMQTIADLENYEDWLKRNGNSGN